MHNFTQKKGRGRRPIPEEAKSLRVNVALYPHTMVRLREIGRGNLSKGIRLLLEERDRQTDGQLPAEMEASAKARVETDAASKQAADLANVLRVGINQSKAAWAKEREELTRAAADARRECEAVRAELEKEKAKTAEIIPATSKEPVDLASVLRVEINQAKTAWAKQREELAKAAADARRECEAMRDNLEKEKAKIAEAIPAAAKMAGRLEALEELNVALLERLAPTSKTIL
jgi:hypothetical protein